MNLQIATKSSVGNTIREWRQYRRLSQLALALRANISARHLSFVETGRSHPSRELLLLLCEELEIPIRDRNAILNMGGFADVYTAFDLNAPELEYIKSVFELVLDRYDPFAAVCLNGSWDIVMANRSFNTFFNTFFGDVKLDDDVASNLLKLMFHPQGLSNYITNWEEVARESLRHARLSLERLPSERGEKLLSELAQYPTFPKMMLTESRFSEPKLLIPVQLKKGDIEINIFSAVLHLGSAKDVTLNELHIEAFLPADKPTEERIRALSEKVA